MATFPVKIIKAYSLTFTRSEVSMTREYRTISSSTVPEATAFTKPTSVVARRSRRTIAT